MEPLIKKGTPVNRNVKDRNRRYAEMLRLRDEGSYFSNEKMREREPLLFDMILGKYLPDSEKFYLRPTVKVKLSNGAETSKFTNLLEQLDETQRISDRRKRHLNDIFTTNKDFTNHFVNHITEADEDCFQMEFDSSDDEGREAELERQKKCAELKKQKNGPKTEEYLMNHKALQSNVEKPVIFDTTDEKLSELKVSSSMKKTNLETEKIEQVWSSGDEDDNYVTGVSYKRLQEEFVSMMEQRFLNGKDCNFFDYSILEDDNWDEKNPTLYKMREQDLEDAYFDADDD